MDTDRLKYYCAIVDFGSLSKASEILGISHSGLSKSLSTLQAETGLELLRPQGRGLEVTTTGLEFYEKASEILTLVEGLNNPSKKIAPPTRLALSEVLAVTVSGSIAKAIKQNLAINQLDVGEIEHLVITNQLDFGIASVPKPDPKLEYLKIGKIRFNSYCSTQLYKSVKQKEDIPYAVPLHDLPKNIMGFKVRDGWPASIKRNEAFHVKNFSIALNLLRSSEAAAFLPDFIISDENKMLKAQDMRIIKIKEHDRAQIEREYFLIKLKSAPESSEMKKVAKVVRKLCV
jgi:DNA-binding transcriptional LysR family regulator